MDLKILSIVKSHTPGFCNVVISDGTSFHCSNDLAIKYNIYKGRIVNSELIALLQKEQKIYNLKQAAYNYASYKKRTEHQVNEKLLSKGFTNGEILIAIEFLKKFDLLDDEKFANDFVRYYKQQKKAGKSRIISELLKRGVAKDISLKAYMENTTDTENYLLAIEAAQKKLKSIRSRPVEKQKSSISAYLARQGFDWDTIRSVMKEVLGKE